VTGGRRDGAFYQPTILDHVDPGSRVSCEELFGPAVAITRFSNVDEAIALANDSRFGLSAGVFTQDVDRAMRFARELDSGNIHINWSSQWRADLMPYGGLKHSGMGKEGPKYAIREMTEKAGGHPCGGVIGNRRPESTWFPTLFGNPLSQAPASRWVQIAE
jgi:glyceraldehyde-3-phosphate dehydrogenase (NADP+)